MKNRITLLSILFTMVVFVSAQTVTLSPSTSTSVSGAASPWSFSDGGYIITVSNVNSKTYSTGTVSSVSYVKYSAGVQYTVTLPANLTVSRLQFTGYDNYAGKRSYISEFNGILNTDSTVNSFTAKNGSTAIICSNVITPASAITNSFTFTFTGNQTVVNIVLNPTFTAINNAEINVDNNLVDVYSLDGRRLKTKVNRNQVMNELGNGMYIIENRKVVINRVK